MGAKQLSPQRPRRHREVAPAGAVDRTAVPEEEVAPEEAAAVAPAEVQAAEVQAAEALNCPIAAMRKSVISA